mmetsp:Transcript_100499/g.279940  ORF Transcript_100499/g.279940 Transcript_100499/m.279940 type:complete len:228 (-) Transcript_100499:291-974(-)
MRSTSRPRPRTSVPMRTRILPSRKDSSVFSRCCCFTPPCITPHQSNLNCCMRRFRSSVHALRWLTKISTLPGMELLLPRASLRYDNNNGIFLVMPLSSYDGGSTSTIWRIVAGGKGTPALPGNSLDATLAETCANRASVQRQRRRALSSTSGRHVAEKRSTCGSPSILSKMLATALSKSCSSILSASSRTTRDNTRRAKWPLVRKSSNRPGVATTKCVPFWRRKVCN